LHFPLFLAAHLTLSDNEGLMNKFENMAEEDDVEEDFEDAEKLVEVKNEKGLMQYIQQLLDIIEIG
jgi:hypothetical protein